MAMRMLYSLTSVSTALIFSCVGAQTIIGRPAALAYSNCLRRSSTVTPFVISTLPPEVTTRPAASNSARPALVSSGGVARGPARLFFLGGRADLEVNVLDADVLHLHLLEHLDGGGPVEVAQRVGGDPQLHSPRLGLHDGVGRRGPNRAEAHHSGRAAEKTAA